MTDIEEKIAKAEEEIRQLQNRKRKLLNQKKDAERKARTHRLIERGAILESLLEKPEQYSNEQIKEKPLIWQFADLESRGTGSRSCQEMRGTGSTAGAGQRKDAEQTA